MSNSEIAGLYDSCRFSLVRNCQIISTMVVPFAFLWAMYEWFSFSTFLSAFGFVTGFHFSHPNWCVLIFHAGFNWHFLIDYWCWLSFYVSICHLYMLFYEMSVHVFAHILSWIVCFFLLFSFESSLYILGIRPLSDMGFFNIFLKSVACLFILLGSLAKQNFYFLWHPIYQFFLYGLCFW